MQDNHGDLITHRTAASAGVMLLALVVLSGCRTPAATMDSADPSILPAPFALELQCRGTDRRHVYYALQPNGSLDYAGGADALAWKTTHAGALSEAQRLAIWRLIVKHRLLEAPSSAFATPEKTAYEVKLTCGSAIHKFRSVDDQVAGLTELDAMLFEYQRKLRFNKVFQPIDEAIREGNQTQRR